MSPVSIRNIVNMSECTSGLRHRNFSFVAVMLITLFVCRPLAQAQNATVGSKRVSANKKAGASQPDVQRFRARVDAALLTVAHPELFGEY